MSQDISLWLRRSPATVLAGCIGYREGDKDLVVQMNSLHLKPEEGVRSAKKACWLILSLLLKQNCLLSCALSQCLFLFLRVSWSPGRAQIFYLPQLLILFTLLPKYWGFICVSPSFVNIVLEIEPRTLPTLHKPPTELQSQPTASLVPRCLHCLWAQHYGFLSWETLKETFIVILSNWKVGGKSLDLIDH